MARRGRSTSESGVNLDSLMDALTNVVAVLILVLVLVQADVSKKVVEFFEGLQPATPEQVAVVSGRVEELHGRSAELDRLLAREAPQPDEIEAERRQLALLEKNAKKRQDLLVKLEGLRELALKERARRDAEAQKTAGIQKKISELEALLDETPAVKIEPAVVAVPSSRPVPKNARVYYALVINDRVHLIDPFTPVDLFKREFQKVKSKFPFERIRQRGADRLIYEAPPILKHFKDFDFGTPRGQKHEFIIRPTSTRAVILISPDLEKGGTSLEDLNAPRNSFSDLVSKLRRNEKAVLIFWVHPNSFQTYLLARRVTDEAKFPAGWEIRGSSNYQIVIPDLEVKRQKEPPPPPPAPPGPPPRKPPAIPTRID